MKAELALRVWMCGVIPGILPCLEDVAISLLAWGVGPWHWWGVCRSSDLNKNLYFHLEMASLVIQLKLFFFFSCL